MRRMLLNSPVLICVLMVIPALCLQAKEMYVRDWIVVSVRSAPYETAQAVANASTNDLVDVQEEAGGWSRIRTKEGLEGWVQSRYLSVEPPRTQPVRQLEDKIKALQEENKKLRSLKPSVQPGAGTLASQTGAGALGNELAFSDCPELQASYEKLLKDSKAQTEKTDLLLAENSRLKTSDRLVFTLIGGLFIAIGVVLGLFLQAVRSRPRKPGLRF